MVRGESRMWSVRAGELEGGGSMGDRHGHVNGRGVA